MRNSFVLQTYIKFLIFTNLMFYKTINQLDSKKFGHKANTFGS